jgi:hypothetical protein
VGCLGMGRACFQVASRCLPACWVGKGLGDMELFLRPGFGRAGRLGGRSAAGVVVWMGGHSESRVKGGSEAGLFLRV